MQKTQSFFTQMKKLYIFPKIVYNKYGGIIMLERNLYLDKIKKLKDKQIIKVITGIRRSGKSTILKMYKEYLIEQGVDEEQIISINFEDNSYNELLDANKLHEYITKRLDCEKMNYIFLDEIQMVPNFEKCINSLFLKENVDIYITGSNSYMLSGELATFLTGRYMEIHVLPLSFKEYVLYYGESDLLIKYSKYLENGGFPYLINLEQDKELIYNYLDSIYTTVIMKDIISRKQINDVLILESVIRFLFDNVGSLCSTKKISDTLISMGRKNSVNTIENYINALTESYIMYRVHRYDIKGKQHLKTLEKYYLADIGLRNYLLGNKADTNMGYVLENIVFLELKRRGYEIYIGKNDTEEVDFVVSNQDGLRYIQVALSVKDEKTLERELKPLNNIKDHFPKVLITFDFEPVIYHNGIKQINIIDFLLGKEKI